MSVHSDPEMVPFGYAQAPVQVSPSPLWQVEVFPSVEVTEQLPLPPSHEQVIVALPACDVSAVDSCSCLGGSPSVPRLMTDSFVLGTTLSIALVPPDTSPVQNFVVPALVAPSGAVSVQALLL